MSTINELPTSAKFLTGDQYCWQGTQDNQTREETFTWVVPWKDSNAFYATVVGKPKTFTIGNVSMTRNIPLQHPYNANLYATKLAWKGKDGPNKPAEAPYAQVFFTVTFGYLGYSTGGDDGSGGGDDSSGNAPFVKITAKSASQTVTDPEKKYTISPHNSSNTNNGGNTNNSGTGTGTSGGSGTYNANVAKRFAGQSYQMELFCIPDIAQWETLMAGLEGRVNSIPFQLGSFNRDVGTVLLESYGYQQTIDVQGNAIWTGTIDLNYSTLPWNSVFKGGQLWDLSPSPYDSADLNGLYY